MEASKGIRHLELGAANYVRRPGLSRQTLKNRYLILERVVDRLVAEYGPQGIIYLNDIEPSGLELAERYLKHYLRSKGMDQIEIKLIAGDYNKLTLDDLDGQPVQTLYLNNPDKKQLPSAPEESSPEVQAFWQHDYWTNILPKTFNEQVTQNLLRLSSLSVTGLRINSYIYGAMDRMARLLPPGSLKELPQSGDDYFDMNGTHYFAEKKSKVFILKSATPLENQSESDCEGQFAG